MIEWISVHLRFHACFGGGGMVAGILEFAPMIFLNNGSCLLFIPFAYIIIPDLAFIQAQVSF